MAKIYPNNCHALHLNFVNDRGPKPNLADPTLDEAEKRGLGRGLDFNEHGSGYRNMHATAPVTIGAVLSASPVSLRVWIGEKMRWCDLATHPSDDEVLTNILLYWFTGKVRRLTYVL